MTIKHKRYLWLDVRWEDSWFSSHSLVKNLKRCYQEKLGPDLHVLSLPLDPEILKNYLTANQITSVILADPRINLGPVLKSFAQFSNNELEFLIHVIGSPLRKLEDLKNMKIDKHRVCLLAGSQANYEILKNFSQGAVKYFPFLPKQKDPPVIEKKEIKNKFIYFGRISHRKNVVALLELFARYQKEINPEAELSLYGGVCNSNFPTKPPGHYIGMSGERFFLKLAELQQQGHKISYHGQVEREIIQAALKEHNTFLSLSTAEEEDFGMSVFEALSSGLSCVVSNWNGYREFKDFDQVGLVDVIHQEGTLFIDQDQFFSYLNLMNNRSETHFDFWYEQREKIIAALDLNFEQKKHNFKLASNFFKEEFFNEHEELVSPYWR